VNFSISLVMVNDTAIQIFEEWVKETERHTFEVTGRILDVMKKGNSFLLEINFDPQIVTLFKEVRNLQWLGYRIPFAITLLSSGGRQVYPFAVSLKEIIRTYTQTCTKIVPEMALLIAAYKKDVQKYIEEGMRIVSERLIFHSKTMNNLQWIVSLSLSFLLSLFRCFSMFSE
jgi:dynein heavy chain 1